MHRILITLFCIIFVVGINGAWLKPLTSIDEDAIAITQLLEKFWSLKPAILKNTRPLVYCQIIDQCCEDEDRSKAISLMSQYIDGTDRYSFTEVMYTCINLTASNKADESCSSILTSVVPPRIAYSNSDVKKYFDIISKYVKELDHYFYDITLTCNSEETHAVLCSSDRKLIEICTGKILQKIYDDNDKNYQAIMMNTKRVLIDLHQQLFEAFIENTNTD